MKHSVPSSFWPLLHRKVRQQRWAPPHSPLPSPPPLRQTFVSQVAQEILILDGSGTLTRVETFEAYRKQVLRGVRPRACDRLCAIRARFVMCVRDICGTRARCLRDTGELLFGSGFAVPR